MLFSVIPRNNCLPLLLRLVRLCCGALLSLEREECAVCGEEAVGCAELLKEEGDVPN